MHEIRVCQYMTQPVRSTSPLPSLTLKYLNSSHQSSNSKPVRISSSHNVTVKLSFFCQSIHNTNSVVAVMLWNLGVILNAVTFYFNTNSLNTLEEYVPTYVKDSYYFYKDQHEINATFKPVKEDRLFNDAVYFPKCCPPGLTYESGNRECTKAKNVPIHEELGLEVDLIRSGLFDCPVVVDRFVRKDHLYRLGGDGKISAEGEAFPLGYYCIDNTVQKTDYYMVRLCKEKKYCLAGSENYTKEWCVRKCCQDGFGFEDYKCSYTPKTGVRVKFKRNYYEKSGGYAVYHSSDLKCSVANWYDFQEVNFSVRINGSLFRYEKGDAVEYKADEYCLDTMFNTDQKRLFDLLILCEFSNALAIKWDFIKAFVIITCIFLVMTIVAYTFTKKFQKLIITCFCCVDLLFWMMYAMRIFSTNFGKFCTAFGYLYFFVMLSRLSWLNIVSYELWLTIGNPTTRFGKTMLSLLKRKYYYILYALVVPTIATLAFIMAHREIHPLPKSVRPYIDKSSCAIDVKGTDYNYGYIYLYIPVSILTTINVVIFVRVLRHFLKIKDDMRRISNTTSEFRHKMEKTNKRRGTIILKLGLIMLVTWIYYIFSYLSRLGGNHPVLVGIGDFLMFLNIFEGVYFFVIFVVKWKTVKEVLYRFKIMKKDPSIRILESTSTESLNDLTMQAFHHQQEGQQQQPPLQEH